MSAKIEEPPPAPPRASLAALRPSDLPAPPQAALRVLQACADPSIDARRLGRIVGADPALTAEILRIVNSAYFGFAREVRTVARAVAILGQQALRSFVLCVAAREALRPEVVHGLDTTPYWDAALRRATAARLLAPAAGLDPDESFTLGLLQDVGLLALVYLNPARAGAWDELVGLDPEERLCLERELFGLTHDDVGYALTRAWGLPETLAGAIGGHHRFARDADAARFAPACRVALGADWIASVYARRDVAGARAALAREWHMDGAAADAIIGAVGEQAREAAAALGLSLGEPIAYERILRESNLALAEQHLGHQELAWRLERAVAERDRLAGEMRREIEKAKVVQRGLLPAPPPCGEVEVADAMPIAGINAPARDLSGDFFDYFPVGPERWLFNLADVSGKGMDAALMMAKTSSLLRCLGKRVHDPRRLLALVNDEVCETAVRGMFVSVVAGVLDLAHERAVIVNAGHPPPLVHGADGEFDVVAAHGPPLGVMPGMRWGATSVGLAGASLYVFSDGLIEAAGGGGARLGFAGVMDLVRAQAAAPKGERLVRMLAALGRARWGTHDDVTLLVVEPGAPHPVPARGVPRAAQGIVPACR